MNIEDFEVLPIFVKTRRRVAPNRYGNKSARFRSCSSKQRYHSPEAAKDSKFTYERRRGEALRFYHCTVCNGYHLTRLNA